MSATKKLSAFQARTLAAIGSDWVSENQLRNNMGVRLGQRLAPTLAVLHIDHGLIERKIEGGRGFVKLAPVAPESIPAASPAKLTRAQAITANRFKPSGCTVLDVRGSRESSLIRRTAEALGRSCGWLPNDRMLVGPVGFNRDNSLLFAANRRLFDNWVLFINLVNSTDPRNDDQPHHTTMKEGHACELKRIVEKMAWILRKFPELVDVFEAVGWGYQTAKRMVHAEMDRQDAIQRQIVEAGLKPDVLAKGHQYGVMFIRACNPVTRREMFNELRIQVPGLESSLMSSVEVAAVTLADIVISNLEAAGLADVTVFEGETQVDFPAAHYYEPTREQSERIMARFAATGVR